MIIIGDAKKTCEISNNLFQQGYMVPAVRPPTVKAGTSRLRVSITSEHKKNDINELCKKIKTLVIK